MKIEDTKPKLKVTKTKGVFQTSTKTWSDPTVMWSDPNQCWGGGDIFGGLGVMPSVRVDNLHLQKLITQTPTNMKYLEDRPR